MLILILLLLFCVGSNASDSEEVLSEKGISIGVTGTAEINSEQLGCMKGEAYNICFGKGQCKGVDQFLGIPYAKKPERFAKPEKYEGKFDCESRTFSKRPPACMQYVPESGFDVVNPAAKIWVPEEVSEDCLFLNVWSPKTTKDGGHPVMVWIFGGGFFSGSASLDVYDGRILAAVEDVTVASMQYRVGAFGFLYKPPDILGNMGLQDQQLALEWIKTHISDFGGDSNQITIFGESAGSASVGFHYLNPTSREYFKRAIMESASPFNRWALSTKSQAEEVGRAFTKACNCSYKDSNNGKEVDCLKKLTEDQVVGCYWDLSTAASLRRGQRLAQMHGKEAWSSEFLDGSAQYFDVEMRPVLDDAFLQDCPNALLKNIEKTGRAPEMLIGNVDKEGMYWLFYGLSLKGVSFLNDDGTLNLPTMDELTGNSFNYQELIETRFVSVGHLVDELTKLVTERYGLSTPDPIESNTKFLNKFDHISGDMDFTCGTLLFAKALSTMQNSKIWFFDFMHKTENNELPAWTGAMHGYEIEYVFGMPFSAEFRKKYYGFTDAEMALSQRVMKYWANFARAGDPNGENAGGVSWSNFAPNNENYLEIKLKSDVMKKNLRKKGCGIWNTQFPNKVKEYLKRHGHGVDDKCPYLEKNVTVVEPLSDYVMGGKRILTVSLCLGRQSSQLFT
ncbi:unnamed protein product [Hymenolepis diminuta]|uniref:Carboxylic ester hydrolase n=1 Tax=Hymenolepis diminuta TaxID=6216 RepID=A0A0R3SL39_HYMDI|nr:unnamed protein product [Hymenolepis diminuta]